MGRNYIIFGGSGFIGTHLIHLLKAECVKPGDRIYDADIVMPGEEGVVPGIVEKNEGVQYIRLDVREPFDFDFDATGDDIIFNLAAVHRTPGHEDYEYFETNIRGAENVTAFAEKHGIKKLLFTSSIAPYAASEEEKFETTLPTPNTPYGISKLVAEKIHEKWQAKDPTRELTIVRPGVVYGKGEHGNMTRLYNGMKGHYFAYTGRKDTIKASVYVKELCLIFKYRMIDNSFPGVDVYNCTFEPAYSIQQICETMQAATGLHVHIPFIPAGLLMTAARILGPIGGKKIGIHPARVKKLMVSTNICGKKLLDSGYKFHYTLEESFRDWWEDCNGKNGGPIRVAVVLGEMGTGGIEHIVMDYYRHIDRRRVQFDFYVHENSKNILKDEIESLGGTVTLIPPYSRVPAYVRRLEDAFKSNKYNIVHIHLNTMSVFAQYAAKRANVPVRITHNHSTAGKGEAKRNAMKYVLRLFANRFVTDRCACSAYAGAWMWGKKALADGKITIWPNAIDVEKFAFDEKARGRIRKEYGLDGKFVVGHIGRFMPQKNHTFLIDVFDELQRRRGNAVLLLVGEGEIMPEICDKVKSLSLSDKVIFAGATDDAAAFYSAFDAFVLPSLYEGLPIVGVEAQASGLPCYFADNITRELDIANANYVENKLEPWVEILENAKPAQDRAGAAEKIRAAGFDISDAAARLTDWYEELDNRARNSGRGGASANLY